MKGVPAAAEGEAACLFQFEQGGDDSSFMSKKYKICVLGGTGFVGYHLVHELAEQGHALRVLVRRRERHRDLLVMPMVDVIEADIHDPAVLGRHLAGCDAAVNLVGILNERKRPGETFQAAHVDLVQRLVEACRDKGVKRLLHMSALHADAGQGPSRYLRSKGQGEDAAHEGAGDGIEVTSFRPSVIFGPGDHFFNRFARLLKLVPLPLPLACPETRYAPVFVDDVVHAFCCALNERDTFGRRYELCGPHQYTLRQLVEYTARISGHHKAVIGLGDGLSRLQARLMGHMPGRPLTYDNYLTMQAGGTCEGEFPAMFGIRPASVEAVVPYYLLHQNQRAKRFGIYRRLRRTE